MQSPDQHVVEQAVLAFQPVPPPLQVSGTLPLQRFAPGVQGSLQTPPEQPTLHVAL
jgi:hypothetical protein